MIPEQLRYEIAALADEEIEHVGDGEQIRDKLIAICTDLIDANERLREDLRGMSQMAQMSRAIRTVIERHSADGTLSGLADDDLRAFHTIVGAFYRDLADERDRR